MPYCIRKSHDTPRSKTTSACFNALERPWRMCKSELGPRHPRAMPAKKTGSPSVCSAETTASTCDRSIIACEPTTITGRWELDKDDKAF
mmetsp:Transcript_915/g.1686  ORF Transcript_915/g.1686 Transcript_915/m.1686 type:complete len:89 (-) Transcript_915:615-881(-)